MSKHAMLHGGKLVWLTDDELTRLFLGQLDLESHMQVRGYVEKPEPVQPLGETNYEQPKKRQPKPPAIRRVEKDQGLPL